MTFTVYGSNDNWFGKCLEHPHLHFKAKTRLEALNGIKDMVAKIYKQEGK